MRAHPLAITESTWYGDQRRTETPFYLVDIHLTVGLMGMVTEDYVMRGISVVPGEEFGHRPGIFIGSDLIRRGQLIIDGSGIGICL